MNTKPGNFVRSTLALGVASALLALSATSAQAATFDFDDVEVVFDSTFSYGASWRAEDRNWDTISKVNHPRFDWTGYNAGTNQTIYTPAQIWSQPGAYSSNGDAGNLNYDRGDMFSEVFRGTHELSVTNGDFGFFGRFTYFYDSALMDDDGAYSNPVSGNRVDPCADDDARDLACRDIRLLDAYIYGNFALNDGANPLSVRIGNQVLSWGESTFIPHGINITPVDVGVLRSPGADLKEAFVPVGMAWASLGLTENLTAEVFYQYDWKNSYLPVPGTYFSTNDFAGEGGYAQNIQLGFAGNPDIDLSTLLGALNGISNSAASLFGVIQNPNATAEQKAAAQGQLTQLSASYLAYPTKVTLRPQDNNSWIDGSIAPKDDGQYGIKFELFSPDLNDTEFAVYHMNYHSRVPLISGVSADFRPGAIVSDLAYLAANAGSITSENVTGLRAFSKGFLEYPEDIKLYGFSFNTTVGGTSVAGEFSYRQDEPLQIDDVEILYAGMPEQLAKGGLASGAPLEGISQIGRSYGQKVGSGEFAQGYIVSDTTQLQFTVTHLFGPMGFIDNFTMLAEVGGIKINDMPDQSVLRLNGPNTDRSGGPLMGTINGGPLVNKDGVHTAVSNGAETNPFPTASAWGYRLLAKADFNNVFAGVNMSHRMVFAHDVNGITPDPLFMFTEDKKSLAYSVVFDYLNRWSTEFSYNAFWGGVGTTNNIADRDFVSFNIKYSI